MANVGRPTLYKKEYVEQVYKLCLLSAIDKDIADFFDIEESTLNLWKIEHPEFMESLKKGKQFADANVADRLYQRAMGYEHSDTEFASFQGQITDEKEYTKHYPPDTAAAIFWLKNRQRGKWSDKIEIDQKVTTNDSTTLSDEQLTAKIKEIAAQINT